MPSQGQWIPKKQACTFVRGVHSPLRAHVRLDDRDAERERRGLRFARDADDCRIFVRSQAAAPRVLRSISRFSEGRVRRRINWTKSKAARRSAGSCLGFELPRGKWRWTDAAVQRFTERIRAITARSNGRRMASRIEARHRDVTGWLHDVGHRHSDAALVALDHWRRRRVRRCAWKQGKRPRTRRRHRLALGLSRDAVQRATRSRKGDWRMAGNSIVHRALTHQWLWAQGVPNMRHQGVGLHDGAEAP
jgi:RNA-directed DNA polymerase